MVLFDFCVGPQVVDGCDSQLPEFLLACATDRSEDDERSELAQERVIGKETAMS